MLCPKLLLTYFQLRRPAEANLCLKFCFTFCQTFSYFHLNRSITIGEEFCNKKSDSLQSSLRQQTENYFKAYHK